MNRVRRDQLQVLLQNQNIINHFDNRILQWHKITQEYTHKRAHTHSGLDDASSFTSLHTCHIQLVLKCLHFGGLEAQVSDRLFASHVQGPLVPLIKKKCIFCFLNHVVLRKGKIYITKFHIKIERYLINIQQKYLPLISDELAMYINDYDKKMVFAIHCLSKLSLTFFRLSVV